MKALKTGPEIEDSELWLWIVSALFAVLLPLTAIAVDYTHRQPERCIHYHALAEAGVVIDTSQKKLPPPCD